MKKVMRLMLTAAVFVLLTSESGCEDKAVSTSGVLKATTKVQTDLNGNTIEQNNIINRLKEDNKPGSIKHLYIISSYSGQVIMYSTVKGKVTSSGKRLSPSTVYASNNATGGFEIDFGSGNSYYTNEVLSDDGAYGSSVEYIYWWDSKGIYNQIYISGGMICVISNQPIANKSVTLNLEIRNQ